MSAFDPKQPLENRLTGGPWGTLAQVEPWRAAMALREATPRTAACLLANLTVESIV